MTAKKEKKTNLQLNETRYSEILADEYLHKILEVAPNVHQQELIINWLDKYDELHGIENREVQECMQRLFLFIDGAKSEGYWHEGGVLIELPEPISNDQVIPHEKSEYLKITYEAMLSRMFKEKYQMEKQLALALGYEVIIEKDENGNDIEIPCWGDHVLASLIDEACGKLKGVQE